MAVPGPQPTIQFVQKDSIITATISGSVDGNGASLTDANTTWFITVSDWASNAVILAQTAMTYSGTPGTWTYSVPAAVWGTPYDDRYVLCQEYDQNGVDPDTLRLTLNALARFSG